MNFAIVSDGFSSILKKSFDDIPFSFLFCKGKLMLLSLLYKKQSEKFLKQNFFGGTNKYYFFLIFARLSRYFEAQNI